MGRAPEKWFALRTDFFGQDAYTLGLYKLSPQAVALYVASISHACRWGTDTVPKGCTSYVGIKRPNPVIDELVTEGFWAPAKGGEFYVHHEGTLWRRGDGVRRRPIPSEIRRHVMERDNFACVECGSDFALSIDHIWPYSKGGTDDPDNLRVLCRSCNSRKGARTDGP